MKIGYLHIGSPQHGICRYGRLLATEAHKRPELTVIETAVTLTNDRARNQDMLADAAQYLSSADVVHLQHNDKIWGRGWAQLQNLRVFFRHCKCPLVVTLHDIYAPPSPTKNPVRFGRYLFSLNALSVRLLVNQAKLILICTEEEVRRLKYITKSRKIKVVPHFVEERSVAADSAEVRSALGLKEVRTVTILGFIWPRKGHQLMVEAMPELPQDVQVIFAGGPSSGCEELVRELVELAKAKGVADRLRLTGYLSEEELEHYLVATDLAVCSFRFMSASGSLSTWISVARPILASSLPQIEEYNQLEPGAIKTFKPYTPTALAKAIRQLLPNCQRSDDPGVARLRQRLSMPVIFNEHLSYYRHAATT